MSGREPIPDSFIFVRVMLASQVSVSGLRDSGFGFRV